MKRRSIGLSNNVSDTFSILSHIVLFFLIKTCYFFRCIRDADFATQ